MLDSSSAKQIETLEKKEIVLQDSLAELQSFVLDGHVILDYIKGDLNADGLEDVILITKAKTEAETYDEAPRPLILLIRDENGKLSIRRRNIKTVYCYSCGGAMGDPYQRLVIKGNYFSIEHYGGSNWKWEKIITFKYDSEKDGIYLHKVGSINYNLEAKVEEEKILSTKDFGVIKMEDFNIYKY